jgi:hypothetical protein
LLIPFVKFGTCLCLVLVLMCQVVATVAGVAHLTGWGHFVSWLIAIVIGWTPLLGSAIAIYGAIAAWNCPWYGAVALFVWPTVLIIARIGVEVVE